MRTSASVPVESEPVLLVAGAAPQSTRRPRVPIDSRPRFPRPLTRGRRPPAASYPLAAARWAVAGVACALLSTSACSGTSPPRTGSETNFLAVCTDECEGGLTCICGVCTHACSHTNQCASLGSGTECVAGSARTARAACAGEDAATFCDRPCTTETDCDVLGAGFVCQEGYCRTPDGSNGGNPCPTTTLALGDNERTVAVGGATRRYIIRLPDRFTGRDPVPLVLDFHTLGGTPTGEAVASGYRELGEQEGFVVAWPEGTEGAWNIGPCCTASTDVDDVAFARALVRQASAEACIDLGRVYAVGVALGGGMAYHLACNAADVFAGIAPSGFDLLVDSDQPCRPARPVTEIAFRGTADTLVPYDGGAQPAPHDPDVTMNFLGAVATFQRWAELNRCTGSPSEADANGCSTYSNCAEGAEVTLCTTEDGGMDWGSAELGWATLRRHSLP